LNHSNYFEERDAILARAVGPKYNFFYNIFGNAGF
jgi:hypothetical protein